MSKRLLSTALAAVIATAGLASTAQAAGGTINISGKVINDTCLVTVNKGGTVTLPVVTAASFTAVGSVAGTTSFPVELTGCDGNIASAQMKFSGGNIDSSTGNLKNTVSGGSDVQIQLLNDADAAINTSTQANAPTITLASGDGTTTLKAQYISTAASTTAGLVSSSVDFTLTYL
jgi:major type 1 subunit fimbrin (pilin)